MSARSLIKWGIISFLSVIFLSFFSFSFPSFAQNYNDMHTTITTSPDWFDDERGRRGGGANDYNLPTPPPATPSRSSHLPPSSEGAPASLQDTNSNFSVALEQWTESISEHLDTPSYVGDTQGKFNYWIAKVVDVLFPIVLVAGVLIAMTGFYTLLTSSDASKIKNGINLIIYGVIAIILMYSAQYITDVVFSGIFKWGLAEVMQASDWIQTLYTDLAFPFIKIAVYLSLGFLVILMMIRVFTYITAQDDSTKKKALGVIVWTTIGMLIIIASKEIVEAVYGKQEKVLKDWAVTNLSEIGTQILNPTHVPIFFSILNWSLGIVAFVLLVMILIQTYKILTKPDDAATFASLKKTIVYALWGILLIGSAYLISNLLILN